MTKDKIDEFCSLAKTNTRKQVIELRCADLFMTLSDIAKRVNISRQRVHQILLEEGLPTKHLIQKYLYKCPVCGTVSTLKFCSVACKKKWQQIQIVCSRCGKLFIRDRHQFLTNYRHHSNALFCSKDCANKWFGEEYGFKRFPNHIATVNQ